VVEKTSHWYSPVGRCIYCGVASGVEKLGSEHIIPYSLGGNAILPDACCHNCGAIQTYIEGVCARKLYDRVRIQHGLPTRNPKNRPRTLAVDYEFETHVERQFHRPKDAPLMLMSFQFGLPGILRGKTESWFRPVITSSKNFDTRGAKRVKVDAPPVPINVFARMLAKIGHAYATAELGINVFKPLLPEIILNANAYPFYLVGGEPRIAPADPGICHELRLGTTNVDDKQFIMVNIRLFSYLGTPIYRVVVGPTLSELKSDGKALAVFIISIMQKR
jgi:hypothetical protein